MFADLAKRFIAHVEARHENKPQMVQFCAAKLSRLLEYPPIAGARLDRIGNRAIEGNFALHSLRHTMLTWLGESGVDAFTIMRIAGHSSMAVSLRYIHPTPEAVNELSSGCNSPA